MVSSRSRVPDGPLPQGRDAGHQEHHDEREDAEQRRADVVEDRRAVVDPGEQADQHARHDEQQRERAGVVPQLAQDPAGGREGAADAHAGSRRRASGSLGLVDEARGRRPRRRRSRCGSSSPSRVSSASSRPSRISSSRSQRAASSMTWLLTSSVAPAGGQAAEQLPQVAAQHRVEPDGRLVEHQQLGLAEQGRGERDPGLLAAGEPADAGRRRGCRGRPRRAPGRRRTPGAPSTAAK